MERFDDQVPETNEKHDNSDCGKIDVSRRGLLGTIPVATIAAMLAVSTDALADDDCHHLDHTDSTGNHTDSHLDQAGVNYHQDTGPSQNHYDLHFDGADPHSDLGLHIDGPAHADHTDMAFADGLGIHADKAHGDHSDSGAANHVDFANHDDHSDSHCDSPHQDFHSDSPDNHTDMHTDRSSPHTDFSSHYDGHSDYHDDHVDTGHGDHGDSHLDVAHIDDGTHSDAG